MDRPVRIAVVGPAQDRLQADLRQLPLRPEVRSWVTLLADAEGLSRYQPDLLAVTFGATAEQEVGALRLLQQWWPSIGLLLVTTAERELVDAPLAARLQARLLLHADAPGQLAAAIEQALHGSDRPRPDAFVDLARGLADEINNPLQYVAGHLQLLRASFATAQERDRRDQIGAALQGIDRIRAALDRLRLLAQAANGPRRSERVDLAAVVRQASQTRPESPAGSVVLELGPTEQPVPGDQEQLTAAVAAIVRFADELAAAGAGCHLQLDTLAAARRLRLSARIPSLGDWKLPQTFEPFYPSRALRGRSQGLGVFLAQTVILGHGGQATVRRLGDGTLQFDFVLPA
jgi:nitrogen-specific signal transduction histidine kinase